MTMVEHEAALRAGVAGCPLFQNARYADEGFLLDRSGWTASAQMKAGRWAARVTHPAGADAEWEDPDLIRAMHAACRDVVTDELENAVWDAGQAQALLTEALARQTVLRAFLQPKADTL